MIEVDVFVAHFLSLEGDLAWKRSQGINEARIVLNMIARKVIHDTDSHSPDLALKY